MLHMCLNTYCVFVAPSLVNFYTVPKAWTNSTSRACHKIPAIHVMAWTSDFAYKSDDSTTVCWRWVPKQLFAKMCQVQFRRLVCLHISQTIVVTHQLHTERFSIMNCQVGVFVILCSLLTRRTVEKLCVSEPNFLLKPHPIMYSRIMYDCESAVSQSTHLLNSSCSWWPSFPNGLCSIQTSPTASSKIIWALEASACLSQRKGCYPTTHYCNALLCTRHHHHTQRWEGVWCSFRPPDYWFQTMVVPACWCDDDMGAGDWQVHQNLHRQSTKSGVSTRVEWT